MRAKNMTTEQFNALVLQITSLSMQGVKVLSLTEEQTKQYEDNIKKACLSLYSLGFSINSFVANKGEALLVKTDTNRFDTISTYSDEKPKDFCSVCGFLKVCINKVCEECNQKEVDYINGKSDTIPDSLKEAFKKERKERSDKGKTHNEPKETPICLERPIINGIEYGDDISVELGHMPQENKDGSFKTPYKGTNDPTKATCKECLERHNKLNVQCAICSFTRMNEYTKYCSLHCGYTIRMTSTENIIVLNITNGCETLKDPTPPKPETKQEIIAIQPAKTFKGNLTQEQYNIVKHCLSTKRHLVVSAFAGCGKTTTAGEIVYAINQAYPQAKILFVQFNKIPLMEVKTKFQKLGLNVTCDTYHATGNKMVLQLKDARPEAFSKPGKPSPDKGKRAKHCLQQGETLSNISLNFKEEKLATLLFEKARVIAPEFATDYSLNLGDLNSFGYRYQVFDKKSQENEVDRVCKVVLQAIRYAKEPASYSIYDVNDQIFLVNALNLKNDVYDYIIVDECQDTSKAMLRVAQNCLKSDGKFIAIGDRYQAIYDFIGADSESLDTLQTTMKAEELGLTETRRCPQTTVGLVSDYVKGFKTACTEVGTVNQITLPEIKNAVKPNSFVLSRTNGPLSGIMFDLIRNNIQAKIYGKKIGEQLIKTCQDIIKKHNITNCSDFVEQVNENAEKEKASIAWLEKKNKVQHEKFCAEITDEKDFLLSFFIGETDLNMCMGRIENLFTDSKGEGSVILSTVHKIKGLETNEVVILSDTFKLNSREEKNIAYVAITRNKKDLYFVGLPIKLTA